MPERVGDSEAPSRTWLIVTLPSPPKLTRATLGLATLGLIVALQLFVSGKDLHAQATAAVPLDHPAYVELDVLRAAGLVPSSIVGQGPHSRLSFAESVAEARSRVDSLIGLAHAQPPPGSRQREALARLEAWFATEIERLCALDEESGPECPVAGPLEVRPRVARFDLTWLQSPWRAIPTRYDTPSDFIDGRLNPLVDGNLGRKYVDGWTGGLEGGVELGVGSHLVAVAHPRLSLSEPRGADAGTDLTAHQLYLRSVLGNLAIEIGRDHLFFGQGLESATVVSSNPRGFDMIRLSNDRPFRLPWILSALGPTALSFVAADLGSNRDVEHALFFLWKGAIRPHPNLELGLTNVNVQGGEGIPSSPFWKRLADVLAPSESLVFVSDKLVGIDARLTLPDPGLELYMEFTNTDPDFRRFGQAVSDEAAWLVGASVPSFGADGRFSARAEWRRNGFRPYTHHLYPSGLTLDGLVVGSSLGPAGTGLVGRIGWGGPTHQLGLAASWERYLGDIYRNIPDPETGRLSWSKIEDNPDEVRFRLEGEWTRLGVEDGFEPSARLGWETVDRFDWSGTGRTNWVAGVTLAYRW